MESSGESPRIAGFDFVRALAVFGMVLVNFKIVMGAEQNGPGWLVWLAGLVDGRAAALFVILAGVGVSLMTQNALQGSPADVKRVRGRLLRRAVFLFVIGLLYTPLWPADILHFYGIYIAVGVLVMAAPSRWLWGLAGGLSAAFVALLFVFDYETGWNWETLEYSGFWTLDGMIRHLFFNGFHPVIPWAAFLLAGMWLGRQDLTHPRLRRRVLVLAPIVTVLSEMLSRSLTRWALTGATTDQVENIRAVFGTSPMPPMPLYLLSAGGVAFFTIALCVWLTQRAPRARWWRPFVATGRLALTLYVLAAARPKWAHIRKNTSESCRF